MPDTVTCGCDTVLVKLCLLVGTVFDYTDVVFDSIVFVDTVFVDTVFDYTVFHYIVFVDSVFYYTV